jgi:transcriptional regulator with XRE-family HTH domain
VSLPTGDRESLRRLRLAAGLSQAELGRRLRLYAGHISMFESGTRVPGVELHEVYARALGVTEDVLFAAIVDTPRRPGARVINGHACGPCGRIVPSSKRRDRGRTILDDEFCWDCARPLTASAEARVPIDGFARFVASLDRGPATWSPNVEVAS